MQSFSLKNRAPTHTMNIKMITGQINSQLTGVAG